MAAAAPADRLIAAMAAVKNDLAWLYTDWSVRAPTLESSTAITAMAQEEVGHARVLGGLVGEGVEGERIACLGQPVASWPELLGTVAPAELALAEMARALGACRHEALRARVRKMADEERFHELFVEGWSALLEEDAPEVTAAFRQALGRAQEQTAAWIERRDGDAAAGDVLDPGVLAERCGARVTSLGRVDVAR